MVKTGVVCARIYKVAHAQLLDAPEPLKVAMLDKVVDYLMADCNKSVHGVVKYLSFINGRLQVGGLIRVTITNLATKLANPDEQHKYTVGR